MIYIHIYKEIIMKKKYKYKLKYQFIINTYI